MKKPQKIIAITGICVIGVVSVLALVLGSIAFHDRTLFWYEIFTNGLNAESIVKIENEGPLSHDPQSRTFTKKEHIKQIAEVFKNSTYKRKHRPLTIKVGLVFSFTFYFDDGTQFGVSSSGRVVSIGKRDYLPSVDITDKLIELVFEFENDL